MPGPYPDSWWFVGGPVILPLSTEQAARWFDLGRKVYPGTYAEAEVVWEGMMKLSRGPESVIVADEPLGAMTRGVLGMGTECFVVNITPGLIPAKAEGEVRR